MPGCTRFVSARYTAARGIFSTLNRPGWRVVALWLAALAMLGNPAALEAQNPTTSTLRGTVTGQDGARIAGARVVARHEPTGAEAQAITDASGRYQLGGLRPGGPYVIRVLQLGYATTEQPGVQLRLGQVLVLDFQLDIRPTDLEELSVVVRADPRFSTTNTGAATVIAQEVIQSHPTVERNFLEMAELSPMVTRTSEGGLSISGQNDRYNSIVINGAIHQDLFGASASGVPGASARAKAIPLDAIQEFQVQVAPYDVRASGFTGGLLNAVTRSGTNEWQGSFFGQLHDGRFFGDLLLEGANVAPEQFRKQVLGGTLAGPLWRDRMHLFLSAEVERRSESVPGFSLGTESAFRTGLAADSAARMATILSRVHDLDAGDGGLFTLDNPTANVFGRLDWRIDDAHTLTVHQNYVRAGRDAGPNRESFGAYEFSSSGYRIDSRTHSLMAQLTSRFGEHLYNEVMLNVQRTRDDEDPTSLFPQIDVDIGSSFDGVALQRRVRAGAGYTTQQSALGQDVVQFTNALSRAQGDVTSTFGAGFEAFRFTHRFLPGSLGYYRFDSLADLERNRPSYYEVSALRDGVTDPTVRFSVLQPSLFVQNEHTFPGGLVLYYGIRADMPLFPDRPQHNPVLERELGVRTDELPSGHLLLSPRVGWNWQSELRYMTQIRGGFGVFTGRLPYVWLANAYAQTGLRTAQLACAGALAPGLSTSSSPLACADGSGIEEVGSTNAVVFDPDFRYPRELKASLAFDQRLPLDIVASGEVLLVQTLRQVVVEDMNLVTGTPRDEGYSVTFGRSRQYGDPIAPFGYRQRQRVEGYSHVLRMMNERTRGFAHSITLGLERGFGEALTLGGSYSMNHSDDAQSMVAGDALLNFATNPAGNNPNARSRAPSAFDRPWKSMLFARLRAPERLSGTEVSLLYVGQAGTAYSYVYADDINGDGYPGPGVQLDAGNDLLYVPKQQSEVPGSIVTFTLLEQLIRQEPCLDEARGSILRRNSCRAPASHRLDLKVLQPIRLGRARAELSGNLLNVLNLLNRDWGHVMDVAPAVPVLGLTNREEVDINGNVIPNSRARLRYVGPVQRDPATNQVRAVLPQRMLVPESQWQAQLGLQLFF